MSSRRRCLSLYKKILKLHQGLPPDLKIIGSGYVRDEFKRQKSPNPKEVDVFVDEWMRYYLTLHSQLCPQGIAKGQVGEHLAKEDIEKLNDEQIQQLYRLKVQATEREDHQNK